MDETASEKTASMTFSTIKKHVIGIQATVFAFLILLVWAAEIFQLPSRLFGAARMPPNFAKCAFETIEILFGCSLCLYFSQQLLQYVRYLEGFVSICANCKKVRHNGRWIPIESYISDRSETKFSHGICPACAKELYGVEMKES
ncbi:MAG: hypothetical protein PHV34_00930 [Verrucomicrobiae bacterium]|nr:hypothetical protein [Verrucomicrobiae bacterium]